MTNAYFQKGNYIFCTEIANRSIIKLWKSKSQKESQVLYWQQVIFVQNNIMFLSNTAQWIKNLFLQQVNEYATLKYLMYNAIVYKLEPGRGRLIIMFYFWKYLLMILFHSLLTHWRWVNCAIWHTQRPQHEYTYSRLILKGLRWGSQANHWCAEERRKICFILSSGKILSVPYAGICVMLRVTASCWYYIHIVNWELEGRYHN